MATSTAVSLLSFCTEPQENRIQESKNSQVAWLEVVPCLCFSIIIVIPPLHESRSQWNKQHNIAALCCRDCGNCSLFYIPRRSGIDKPTVATKAVTATFLGSAAVVKEQSQNVLVQLGQTVCDDNQEWNRTSSCHCDDHWLLGSLLGGPTSKTKNKVNSFGKADFSHRDKSWSSICNNAKIVHFKQ